MWVSIISLCDMCVLDTTSVDEEDKDCRTQELLAT